ncbi:NUDIX hydrolase domain-like protein [Lipomyces oligophaga]|uniref:NUDIX hydrolase domain-like protein n=1 Tax=Lipomyces oligophaga TaxID=45792 RepID=UPI0034CF93A3
MDIRECLESLASATDAPASSSSVTAGRTSFDLPSVQPSPGNIRHASVALVLKFSSLPATSADILPPSHKSLSGPAILSQDGLVDYRDAEVLFIKRAFRQSDRWSGHVAFPGGRRDPGDSSDLATAKRETLEEVGLDLDKFADYIGPLRQRYVTTRWGGKIIMILSTFVFVLRSTDYPELILQESEVAHVFWAPISYLLDPSSQSRFTRPLGTSFFPSIFPPLAFLVASTIGSLSFAGILIPQESVYGNFNKQRPPVIIWGLTHSILLDFLAILVPTSRGRLPQLPIPTQIDTRLFVELLGRRYFEHQANCGLLSLEARWTQNSDQEKPEGVLIDQYYSAFKVAIALALTVRIAAFTIIGVRVGKKLFALTS